MSKSRLTCIWHWYCSCWASICSWYCFSTSWNRCSHRPCGRGGKQGVMNHHHSQEHVFFCSFFFAIKMGRILFCCTTADCLFTQPFLVETWSTLWMDFQWIRRRACSFKININYIFIDSGFFSVESGGESFKKKTYQTQIIIPSRVFLCLKACLEEMCFNCYSDIISCFESVCVGDLQTL